MKFYLKNPTKVFMNTKFLVIRFLAVITAASSFLVSCDDDISEVGSNALIGSELNITEESRFSISSGQIDITKPRTNNLDYYLIGDNDHGFGNTTYSILTQLDSYSVFVQESYTETTDTDENGDETVSTTTDIDYELNDITLVIPYRYDLVGSDDDNNDEDSTTSQYYIESTITGESFKYNIYESDYILQKTDPNNLSGAAQEYYGDGSDGENVFDRSFLKKTLITSGTYDLPSTGDIFTVELFYDEDNDGDEDDEYSDEGLSDQFTAITAIRIPLESFRERILEIITAKGGGEDANGNSIDIIDFSRITEDNFTTEIFRGLYIESSTIGGVAEILDFSESFVNAGIQLKFTKTTTFNDRNEDDDENENTNEADDVEVTTEEVITTLKFSESPINIIEKTATTSLPSAETNEEIILQSGMGRIGTIDLFSEITVEESETATEESITLKELYAENILLNDAVLKLTVNPNSDFFLSEDDLPDTIFITDLESGSILSDYSNNFSSSDEDNETLKEGHLISIRNDDGDIITDEDGNIVYEINITRHLSNILRQEDDDESSESNCTLALSVSEDLNLILVNQNAITTRTSSIYNPKEQQAIYQGSLLCFKTVPLFGSDYGSDDNEDDVNKRPRLTLKYTSTK